MLEGDPLEGLAHASDIRFVMKNGRLYSGETLDEVWPETRPLPPLFREDPEPARLPGYR